MFQPIETGYTILTDPRELAESIACPGGRVRLENHKKNDAPGTTVTCKLTDEGNPASNATSH
jgi:hypothetical protein